MLMQAKTVERLFIYMEIHLKLISSVQLYQISLEVTLVATNMSVQVYPLSSINTAELKWIINTKNKDLIIFQLSKEDVLCRLKVMSKPFY